MIYALDNGQGYSAHNIDFVEADPELWGPNIEDFLLWKLKKDQWDDYEAKVVFTAERIDWRASTGSDPVERYYFPTDFMTWESNGPRRPEKGTEFLGRRRAELLVERWNTITDVFRGWGADNDRKLGKPIFLEDFEDLLRDGAFQERK